MKALRATAAMFVLVLGTESTAAQTIPAGATLERVVIVERHGVRPPTKAAADLQHFSQQPWPEWPVAPGELTPHGAEAMRLMGAAIRRTYANYRLLPSSGCPAGVYVWSDSGDERTRASGDAVLKGFGCATRSQHLSDGARDPMFSGTANKLCRAEPQATRAATEALLARIVHENRATYDQGRARLQAVLTPDGCGRAGQPVCSVSEGTDTISVGKNGDARLDGPLDTASSLGEDLLLEYSDGMPLKDVGWGRGANAIADVLPLHALYADVARRNPAIAAQRAAPLVQQIVDLLNDRPSLFDSAAPVPAGTKVAIFLGHDGNLSNLSGVLGTPWSLPGQPDATAPGTALAFERWRAPDGTKTVAVKVLYQTLEDIRSLARLDTPHEVALAPCPRGTCPLAELSNRMAKAVAPECLKR